MFRVPGSRMGPACDARSQVGAVAYGGCAAGRVEDVTHCREGMERLETDFQDSWRSLGRRCSWAHWSSRTAEAAEPDLVGTRRARRRPPQWTSSKRRRTLRTATAADSSGDPRDLANDRAAEICRTTDHGSSPEGGDRVAPGDEYGQVDSRDELVRRVAATAHADRGRWWRSGRILRRSLRTARSRRRDLGITPSTVRPSCAAGHREAATSQSRRTSPTLHRGCPAQPEAVS